MSRLQEKLFDAIFLFHRFICGYPCLKGYNNPVVLLKQVTFKIPYLKN